MTAAAGDPARDAMGPHFGLWSRVDLAAPPEDLRPWLARAAALRPGAEDLHARFVARHDGPQHGDPARTQRYLDALARARGLADAGVAVSLAELAAVMRVARRGAHRYPIVEGFAAGSWAKPAPAPWPRPWAPCSTR